MADVPSQFGFLIKPCLSGPLTEDMCADGSALFVSRRVASLPLFFQNR